MSNCSDCFGSGEVKSEVKTYTYDENENLVNEQVEIVIVPCSKCNGVEEC